MTQDIPQCVLDLIKGDRPLSISDVQQGMEYLDTLSVHDVLALCRSINPRLIRVVEEQISLERQEEPIESHEKAVGTDGPYWE